MNDTRTSSYLEAVQIRLRRGRIERSDGKVAYLTSDGRGRATLPAAAEPYIIAFHKTTDIETLVLELLARGHAVDFRLLKKTVLALCLGNCLINASEIRPHLEAWQQPPLQEPRTLTGLLRARAQSGENLLVFGAAAFALAIWLFLLLPQASRIFGQEPRFLLFALLAPGGILSLLNILSWLCDHLLGSRSSDVGARLSPMGLHLDSDGLAFRSRPLVSLTVGVLGCFALPELALWLGENLLHPNRSAFATREFFRELTPLLLALTLMHGMKSPLSLARAELMKRGLMRGPGVSPLINGIFVTASVIGLCAAFAAIASAVIGLLRTVLPPFAAYAIGGWSAALLQALPFVWALLLAFDLLSSIESLADDFELIAPVRERLNSLSTRVLQGHRQAERERVRSALDANPLFQTLPAPIRQPLTDSAHLIEGRTGTRLIRQGSRSTELFLVLSGHVGVYKRDPTTNQKELILRLGPGSIFGEAGFFLDLPRTADVIALERVLLVRIPRPEAFRIEERSNAHAHDVFRKKIWASQMLSSHSLFQSLPSDAVLHVLNSSEIVTTNDGETIMREGDVSDSLWLLVQGMAEVRVRGEARPTAEAGAVLGEIGLIWNSPRTATVIGRGSCVFLRLHASAFHRLVARNLNFGARLQEIGAERLQRDRQE